MNHTEETRDPNVEYLLEMSQGTSRDELLRMANSLTPPKTTEIRDPDSLVTYLKNEGFDESLIRIYWLRACLVVSRIPYPSVIAEFNWKSEQRLMEHLLRLICCELNKAALRDP